MIFVRNITHNGDKGNKYSVMECNISAIKTTGKQVLEADKTRTIRKDNGTHGVQQCQVGTDNEFV
jgi:hypothetical protein